MFVALIADFVQAEQADLMACHNQVDNIHEGTYQVKTMHQVEEADLIAGNTK